MQKHKILYQIIILNFYLKHSNKSLIISRNIWQYILHRGYYIYYIYIFYCWIVFLDVCSDFSFCCCLWKGICWLDHYSWMLFTSISSISVALSSWHDLVHSFIVDEYICMNFSPVPVLQQKITIKFWTRIRDLLRFREESKLKCRCFARVCCKAKETLSFVA